MTTHHRALVGRSLVLLVAALLAADGAVQILSPPVMIAALTHIGFPAGAGPYLAIVTLSCALLLVPRATAPYGAILTTGFLGGAICSHARLGDVGSPPQFICLALGAAMWGGLVLCDPAVRSALLPRRLYAARPLISGRGQRVPQPGMPGSR